MPDVVGAAARIFGTVAQAGVNVDMIVQNISEEGRTDMTFSCPVDQVARAEKAMQAAKEKGEINFHDLVADTDVARSFREDCKPGLLEPERALGQSVPPRSAS